jgi:hypothetical protein
MLDAIGTIIQTGQGIAPLTWQEIQSWKNLYSEYVASFKVSMWELSAVKDLSYAYCAELGNATDKKRTAPFSVVQIDRTALSNRIFNVLSNIKL